MSADRNLLFGILALQLNFVSRDQLIEGMNSWVLDKAKYLGEIFVASKAMDSEQFKLLDALVDKHVEKHGGDVEKSLQQLSSVDPVATQQLGEIKDPALHMTVGMISGKSLDPHQTLAYQPASMRSSSRFRIIRPYAHGGLGEVFVARDTELSRDVAVKEIKKRYAVNVENRERFLREAEVTGRLEHPGIVPVYGLGTYDDGCPFYAMKFIKGDSLKDAIDKFHSIAKLNSDRSYVTGAVSTQFRELLGRFIDVCNAIHFAHSRGILHRDLKPGNIMLGEYGETLVVDWGLAKVLGERDIDNCEASHIKPTSGKAGTHTLQGTAIGTPAYMSPEQAEGLLDQLGPATDVYSLGATLFHLLTGDLPFPFTPGEAVQRLTAKQVNARVPTALDAVCEKAMNVRPENRYKSAKELRCDLESFLADESVTAMKESVVDKAARWIRKRYQYLIVASISAFAIIVTLIMCIWLIESARKREKTAHRLAETSLGYARNAVDEYFTKVSEEELLNQPGLQPLRRDLLNRALGYYQQFVSLHGSKASLNKDLAKAFYNSGRAQEELDQFEHSIDSYNSALTIQKKLADMNASDEKVQDEIGNVLNALGRVEQKRQRFENALEWNTQAIEVRRGLHSRTPTDTEYARKYANSLMNEGIIYLRTGDTEDAEKTMVKAQAIRQQLSPTIKSPKLFRDYAMGNFNLGLAATRLGKNQEAQVLIEQAVESFKSILAVIPRDSENRRNIVSCYSMLGDLAATIDLEKACKYNEEAIEAQTILTFQNPDVLEMRIALARLYLNTSEMYKDCDSATALDFIEKAIKIFRLAEGPLAPDQQRDFAVSLVMRAVYKQGSDGLEDLKSALSILSTLCRTYPDNVDFQDAFKHASDVSKTIPQIQ